MINAYEILKRSIGSFARPDWLIGKDEIPVFMFHKVGEEEDYSGIYDRNIYLSKNKFEKALLLLQEHFKIVSLKDILDKKIKPLERSCVITFDDGWLDNYRVAFPILKKYAAPATIFIPTGFVGTNKKFWFERLSDIIDNKEVIDNEIVMIMGKIFKYKQIKFNQSKYDIYSHLCERLKGMNQDQIEEILDQMESILKLQITQNARTLLNWSEIQEMGKHNISFGSHGVTHSILTNMDRESKYFEIYQSRKDLLSKNINYINCISFPNGNYDQETLDMALEAGYSIFFSASINKCNDGYSPLLLHRINFSENKLDRYLLFYSFLKAKIRNKVLKINAFYESF